MKKINLFNRNTNLPSYRRRGLPFPWERGPAEQPGGMGITPSPLSPTKFLKFCGTRFGATPSWKEGERSGRGGLWFAALVALFVATPSFAEPTELDKKTVASKAYVDTKQDIIPAGLVEFDDLGTTAAVPALVLTNATGTALNGNTIGFLDLNTFNNLNSGLDELPDTMVPSIGLFQGQIDNILNIMPYWSPLPWSNTQTAAINAYNTTFGTGTNQWAGNGNHLINGQFLANSLALKQNKITTGLFDGEISQRQVQLPSLVSYDSTNGLTGNQIGILTQDEFVTNEGDWYDFSLDDNNTYSHGMDSVVPTVRAVANAVRQLYWNNTQSTAINAYNTTFGSGTNNWAGTGTDVINGQFLANSLALKQNKIAAGTAGNVVTYSGTAGTVSSRGVYNDPTAEYYNHQNTNENELITVNAAAAIVDYTYALGLTCYETDSNGDCLLYTVTDRADVTRPLPIAEARDVWVTGYTNKTGCIVAVRNNTSITALADAKSAVENAPTRVATLGTSAANTLVSTLVSGGCTAETRNPS